MLSTLASHPCTNRPSLPFPLRLSPPPFVPLSRHRLPLHSCHSCHASPSSLPNSSASLSLSQSNSKPHPPPPPPTTLKIAIIGFGNFGQFLAKYFSQQGHTILAHSRTDYSSIANSLDNTIFFKDPHDLCESHPDVVLLCTSILSAEKVLRSIPIQRLRRSTLFVDVLSVKEFPRSIFLERLPPDFDIICTHPMFGPESGKYGWNGLPFVYEKVRIGDSHERVSRCEAFLNIFKKEGCRMIDMSCKEHDEIAAESQFLTHTVGRVLAEMRLKPNPDDSMGYDTLFQLIENTCSDSFELYYGLFMYNKNSTDLLDRIYAAYEEVKKDLRRMVQGILRRRLFGTTGVGELEDPAARCEAFLESFNKEMVDLDENATGVHFVALTIGMILAKLGLKPTSIATKGYETLLKLVEDISSESFDLYIALFMHIKNSNELLDQLDISLAKVRTELYGRLHDILRRQLFDQPGIISNGRTRM
ncbi:arogenate dehydrogenase [Rhynchospora pubera]|uniref:Arogenate dehydrogenase n=1 Tax=Rhynchospora pubera TaxID=906938 RepID=A0AAV8GP50_9POAL|nr:arogenate dehydrogenase [Rhynchospora pubera]